MPWSKALRGRLKRLISCCMQYSTKIYQSVTILLFRKKSCQLVVYRETEGSTPRDIKATFHNIPLSSCGFNNPTQILGTTHMTYMYMYIHVRHASSVLGRSWKNNMGRFKSTWWWLRRFKIGVVCFASTHDSRCVRHCEFYDDDDLIYSLVKVENEADYYAYTHFAETRSRSVSWQEF